MLHAFDTPVTEAAPRRQQWLALLARAPLSLLETALASHAGQAPQWLRAPETGLIMVQGRAGGTGERFNLGEVTLTRCALRLPTATAESGIVGLAYVLGRSHRHAQLAALADALLQQDEQHAVLELSLLAPIRHHLRTQQRQRQAEAQSTKVAFFTVARENDSSSNEAED
ncbi:phosphonate C-P lyase system protein PhnG [Neisseriaceae bacterium TC5R-5]|nr:phosphonate C-P lyase system protein PhnG [Neisseriaceae bacterium TC5R-5]